MVKIQLASDLHLEFGREFRIKNNNNADVLMLAGDITTYKYLSDFKQFLNDSLKEFKNIIYVQGNHEAYSNGICSIENMSNILDKISFELINFHYLNVNHIKIGEYVVVGGTLWTSFNNANPNDMYLASRRMNDYNQIYDFNPLEAYDIHVKTVEYIDKIAKENIDKKIIVITHHAPSMKSISKKYTNELDNSYASDLSELILNNPNIKLWQHGHMHENFDYYIGDCRVVCNPLGYQGYNINESFNPNLVIEV